MYRLYLIIFFLFPLMVVANTTTIPHPFFFTENKGQWDSRVLYKCEARNGMTWFLERDGVTLLTMIQDKTQPPLQNRGIDLPVCLQNREPPRYPMKSHALKFKFVAVGQNLFCHDNILSQNRQNKFCPTEVKSVEASGELPWHNNYFLGNDSTKWAPDCRNFSSVIYRDVWEGIDVEWYEQNGKLEFDFVVQPGADPSQIKTSCDGLDGELSLDGRGELHSPHSKGRMQYAPTGNELRLPTSLGELRTALPSVYQISAGGSRSEVDAQFEITNKNEFGVTLPNGYQKEHTLWIDPLIYSTYLGGSGAEGGSAIASDSVGGVFVTGHTTSTNYPTTPGVGQRYNAGGSDCFVTHLNSTGTSLLYSTYLGGGGGAGWDVANAIINDGNEGVILTGSTNCIDFPTTTGAFQRTFRGTGTGINDCFVTRLNSTGSRLVYSTFLGGTDEDDGNGIVNDGNGGCIVTGQTISADFPITAGAYDASYNGSGKSFVTHLNSAGTQLIYSTYLGGLAGCVAQAITNDGSGGVIVTGITSGNFPTSIGAFDTSYNGGYDGFVSHLNNTGSRLIYSTFLGGSGDDYIFGIVGDSNGGCFVTGQTTSTNFPTTTGAYDTTFHGGNPSFDCFVTHLNSTGSHLLYSTFLGGTGRDGGSCIISDGSGGVILTGSTSSANFPITNGAFQTTYRGGDGDCFVTRFNSTGSQLLYSTYLGGSGGDWGNAIVSDGRGGVIITGETNSTNFPTTTIAYDTSSHGSYDCFITKLDMSPESVSLSNNGLPLSYQLNQNYPNPFNSSTIIEYSLPKNGQVKLELFDLLGRKVSTLVNAKQNAGTYRVQFDGKNLSSGEYFYRLACGSQSVTRKMILMK